jgi:hypothetical protein
MNANRIIQEIDVLKGKIVNLEGELVLAPTGDKPFIQNRIIAAENSLTELYKLLPRPGKNSFPVFEISFITNFITESALNAFFPSAFSFLLKINC